jgi:hypothetical protein
MTQTDRRPLGITLLGWFYLIIGGMAVGERIFTFFWNLLLFQYTNVHWVNAISPVNFVLFTSYLFLGYGIHRYSRIAYVFTLILCGFFALGGTFWLLASLKASNGIEIAISGSCLIFAVTIATYLIIKRKYFFSALKSKKK